MRQNGLKDKTETDIKRITTYTAQFTRNIQVYMYMHLIIQVKKNL